MGVHEDTSDERSARNCESCEGVMTRLRVALIGAAALLWLVPLSEDVVESEYSNGIYPAIQAALTSWSNLAPVALFDVLIGGVVVTWLVLLWRDLRRRRWSATLVRLVVRTATVAAAMYIAFLVVWGFNYRRVPLEAKLNIDYRAVSPTAAEQLARTAVSELNRLYPRRATSPGPMNPSLEPALAKTQAMLGARRPAVPGRPKRTLLDPYFRAASVDGMTDPYFLETMTLSTLLPVEQPMTIAHEWAHLAGYADEGEANFVAWLVCLAGDDAARYSAWLSTYLETLSAVDAATRKALASELQTGPRADLTAIAERARQHVSPIVTAIGWSIYDRYLKANGVERGARSYSDVVRLILGTKLGTDTLTSVTANAPVHPDAAVRR